MQYLSQCIVSTFSRESSCIIHLLVRTLLRLWAGAGPSGLCKPHSKRSSGLGLWHEVRSELYVYALASCAATESGNAAIGTGTPYPTLTISTFSTMSSVFRPLKEGALAVGSMSRALRSDVETDNVLEQDHRKKSLRHFCQEPLRAASSSLNGLPNLCHTGTLS